MNLSLENENLKNVKLLRQNNIQQILNPFCYCRIAIGSTGKRPKLFKYLLLYFQVSSLVQKGKDCCKKIGLVLCHSHKLNRYQNYFILFVSFVNRG